MGNESGELRKFISPEFIFGENARFLAGRYARNFGVGKALVVTDPGVVTAGWTGSVLESLADEGIGYTVFDAVDSNPRDFQVAEGASLYQGEGCDAIIAVGGGSPIDCAKGIGVIACNGGSILTYRGVDNVAHPMPPLICVPTTAGTAADISQFAIITDSAERVKIAIISKAVVPDISLIDPETTLSMDPLLTACTGMDALVHAIEAYVSNASSPITDLHAIEAVRLVGVNLAAAFTDGRDRKARRSMMLASLHAGLAFSNASLGMVHAMAHSLGGYLDTPHGEANAHLLPFVIAYNFSHAVSRYDTIAKALGLEDAGAGGERLVAEITRLLDGLKIGRTLSCVRPGPDDLDRIAGKALGDACMVTNPVIPAHNEVVAIYERLF